MKFQIEQLFDAKSILQGASLMQVSDMDVDADDARDREPASSNRGAVGVAKGKG